MDKPWRRKVPMQRKTRLQRNRIKPKKKNTGPAVETRIDVWTRADDKCERCGIYIVGGGAFSIHHRMPRGMGGTKNPWINDMSNLLLLCGTGTTGCHGWVESHRSEAYEDGLLVHSWLFPWEVPVHVHSNHRLADADGIAVLPRSEDDEAE